MKLIIVVLKILWFICLSVSIESLDVDVDLHTDKTLWKDPSDPLRGHQSANVGDSCDCDCSTYTAVNGQKVSFIDQFQSALGKLYNLAIYDEKRDEYSVDVLMKHVLRQFLARLNVDIEINNKSQGIYRNAKVDITADNFDVIVRYLKSEKANEEFGLREDLRAALENFVTEVEDSETSLFSTLRVLSPYIFLLNVIIVPPAIFVILRSILTFRQGLTTLFIMCFSISYYFAYIRKYQEILAQRFERLDKRSGSGCSPQGLVSEAMNALLSYVVVKDKSECLKSYEDMLIEPIWLVDPLQVFGEVLSNFLLSPFSVAGTHFNKFFNDFFINSPFHLNLLKILCIPLLFYFLFYVIREYFWSQPVEIKRQRKQRREAISDDESRPEQLMVDNNDSRNITQRKQRREAIRNEESEPEQLTDANDIDQPNTQNKQQDPAREQQQTVLTQD